MSVSSAQDFSNDPLQLNAGSFGPPEIASHEITYFEKIGGGCFGSVFRGTCRGQEVAVKKLFRQDLSEKAISEFRKEVQICSRLLHPNVLLFMGACTEPGHMAIVMELMPKGNLETLLHDPKVSLSLFKRMTMAKEVAKGMNWLHCSIPQIIHRDLKPSNLLVDNHGHIRVCDFGLAAVKPHNEKLKDKDNIPGTPLWMAPEVMLGKPLDEKSDIYSFGIVLWEIATQKVPFPEMNSFPIFKRAVCIQNVRPPLSDVPLPSLQNLIQLCWHKSAECRPSFAEIITMIDTILIECAITDPNGQDLWRNHFLGKESVEWDEFVQPFYNMLNTPLPMVPTDCLKHMCIKTLLAEPSSDKTLIDPPDIVTIEKLGAVLDWFGPAVSPPGEQDILSRVMRTCKQPWFHGDIDGRKAESLLKAFREGYFLVRLSTTFSGSFTVSKVTQTRRINHQRIDYKPGQGFTIKIVDEAQETHIKRSAPGQSLRAFLKTLEAELFLIEPCPGSRFRSIFQKRRTEGIDGYLP
eukprot:CAMPEP_0184340384 /NCGR_PEP_ID=MMETSP1089-20130417/9072_1 /TAXON_ID=38269 ORGANISM="Gloeochaete wittrockiana, Strain SAG46.84" /NCGR_SAMPLE_ID=MMETSP1089 /ASSEMBLY_ACC=CAM_ASM_000445 /LENGTH=519 /DNA_ID=CAMNT_0026668183 /DNA_START=54 /DNA_END=1613 /DNA_ORIENTATION=-